MVPCIDMKNTNPTIGPRWPGWRGTPPCCHHPRNRHHPGYAAQTHLGLPWVCTPTPLPSCRCGAGNRRALGHWGPVPCPQPRRGQGASHPPWPPSGRGWAPTHAAGQLFWAAQPSGPSARACWSYPWAPPTTPTATLPLFSISSPKREETTPPTPAASL